MLIELAQHVVADAKTREAEGDCPSERRYSAEQVEAALVTFADAFLAAEAKCDALREALSAILNEEPLTVHVGYDGLGNYVYADAVRTDSDAFRRARALTQETSNG